MTSTSTQPTPETIHKGLPEAIFRRWVHAREEDAKDVEVYRLYGTPLPPSFARDGFEMRQDGRFVQDVIGAADGIVQVFGHWRQSGVNQVAVTFVDARIEDYAFEILAVDAAVLKTRRLPAAGRPEPDDPRLQDMAKLPPAQSYRRIDFEKAEVQTLKSFPPQYVLVVSGTKPYLNMAVDLVPVVYVRQPDYWEIEVVGGMRGIGLPALAPYTVTLRLAGSVGSRGIDILGATRHQRFDVPPGVPVDGPEK